MTSFFSAIWGSSRQTDRTRRRFARTRQQGTRLAIQTLEDRAVLTAGMLDPTFGVGGLVTTDLGGQPISQDIASGYQSVAVQADGKLVVAGFRPGVDFAVVRYNDDGSLDSSFGTNGLATVDFGLGGLEYSVAVAVQADGKVVVAGTTKIPYEGYEDYYHSGFAVARLNADGSLDTSFGAGGKQTIDFGDSLPAPLNDQVAWGVAMQGDKIVVAGQAYQIATGGIDFAVARLNADGSLDNSFDGDGKQTIDFGSSAYGEAAFGVAVLGDEILVAGTTDDGAAGRDFAVARLNSDGSLDTTFDADGMQTIDFGGNDGGYSVAVQADGMQTIDFGGNDGGYSVAVQADGKIVVAGSSDLGTGSEFAVARLNANGSLDNSFDGDGKQTVDFGDNASATGVAVQSNGKIVLAGGISHDDFAVARLNANGSLDNSFDGDGKQTVDFGGSDSASGVAVQVDGKIVVAGFSFSFQRATGSDFAVARLLGDDAVNDAPTAANDTFATYEDSSLTGNVLANDSDPDEDDSLTVITVNGSAANLGQAVATAHGIVVLDADGNFQYTPGAACEATSDSFSYTIRDAAGETSTATVTIALTPYSGVSTNGGILRFGGSAAADVVTVASGNLRVNGVDLSLAGINEVRIWGRSGNDRIDLSGLSIKAFIQGGSGNDELTGGSGDDLILGGLGSDTITGAAGHDFLIGGGDTDRIVGSAGNDILAGGDVACQLSLAALREISQAWASSRSVQEEAVDDFLDEAITDAAFDQLTGSAGADLFLINIGDKITDFQFGKPNTNKDGDVVIRDGVVVQ